MTRKEAISRLKMGEPFSEIYDPVWNEALDMAIEALQIELVRCKDCKHRETDDCPMYWMEWFSDEGHDNFWKDYIIHDYTMDDGYCHCGEREGDDTK